MLTANESRLVAREQKLVAALSSLSDVMVAYSGGVDSSLLAYYARKVLGARARIVIAVSPSIAADELEEARLQAQLFDWDLIEIKTDEVDNPEYRKNDGQRCYFCKGALFQAMSEMASKEGFANLAYGANVADLADIRPGQRAASEYNVLSPLQEAELTKDEIRQLAKIAGLPAWDKPQSACLSSRFPTFETVTPERLKLVENAEIALRKLGLKGFRVRFHSLNSPSDSASEKGPGQGISSTNLVDSVTNMLPFAGLALARIELTSFDLRRVAEDETLRIHVCRAVKDAGFAFVTIDLEGYRQGSSNILINSEQQTADASNSFVSVEWTSRG